MAASHASLRFDNGPEYAAVIRDPFSAEEEARLEWYFEEWLRFPFDHQVTAKEIAGTIPGYGQALFNQVFAERRAFARYQQALQAQAASPLAIEIAGSPEFHALHWEALWDPDLERPFSVNAPVLRKNLVAFAHRSRRAAVADDQPAAGLGAPGRAAGCRLPHDPAPAARDAAPGRAARQSRYRAPGNLPGAGRAPESARLRHGPGHYHVIHFDVHGSLLTYAQYQSAQEDLKASAYTYQDGYGRADLPEYKGRRAFLFLNGPAEGKADPLEAGQLAGLLQTHQMPVVVLNACQSGKQVGASETSLGAALMQAGVQLVAGDGLFDHRQRRVAVDEDALRTALRRARAAGAIAPRPPGAVTTRRRARPISTSRSTWKTGCCR